MPVDLTNLLTKETTLISEGHTGIVRGQHIEDRAGIGLQTIQSLDKTAGPPNNQQIRRLLYTFNETRRSQDLLKHLPLKTPETVPPPRETAQTLGAPETTLPAAKTSGVSGLSSGTKVAIGVGSVAVGGALVVIASRSGDDDEDAPSSFTGTFVWEGIDPLNDSFQSTYTFRLTQEGDLITGDLIQAASGCCAATAQSTISGAVLEENTAGLFLTRTPASCTCPDDDEYIDFSGGTFSIVVTLDDEGATLSDGALEYIRQ